MLASTIISLASLLVTANAVVTIQFWTGNNCDGTLAQQFSNFNAGDQKCIPVTGAAVRSLRIINDRPVLAHTTSGKDCGGSSVVFNQPNSGSHCLSNVPYAAVQVAVPL